MVGYMVTWTTYGTWLQGDEMGYVKDGKVLGANDKLEAANREIQKFDKSVLSKMERAVVEDAIISAGKLTGHQLCAIAVCSNHVHIAARVSDDAIEKVVMRYKNMATIKLKQVGRVGKIWTKGFDKRFCFNDNDLSKRVDYIINENDGRETLGWRSE